MFNCLQININGSKGKHRLFHKLLVDYDIHLAIVSELKTSNFFSYERAQFDRISGYSIYLNSARCAIYVRNDIKKSKEDRHSNSRRVQTSRRLLPLLHCIHKRPKEPTKTACHILLQIAKLQQRQCNRRLRDSGNNPRRPRLHSDSWRLQLPPPTTRIQTRQRQWEEVDRFPDPFELLSSQQRISNKERRGARLDFSFTGNRRVHLQVESHCLARLV